MWDQCGIAPSTALNCASPLTGKAAKWASTGTVRACRALLEPAGPRGSDGAYHLKCLAPPLAAVPEGSWFCPSCASAADCGQCRDAQGAMLPPSRANLPCRVAPRRATGDGKGGGKGGGGKGGGGAGAGKKPPKAELPSRRRATCRTSGREVTREYPRLPKRPAELLRLEVSPLREPPPTLPTASELKAADEAEAAAAAAAAAAAHTLRPPRTEPAEGAGGRGEEEEEEVELGEDGLPLLPHGVAVGGFVSAMGLAPGGMRRRFKAHLLQVRASKTTPLLLKYLEDSEGRTGALFVPANPRAYVGLREVEAWKAPEQVRPPPIAAAEPAAVDGGSAAAPSAAAASDAAEGGGGSTGGERSAGPSRLRTRVVPPAAQLIGSVGGLEEHCGLELHLDPRRTMDGYSGTGYRGVFEDYWPSGYKRERPFTVMYDGSYVGRYATVLRAAVQFARGSRRGCLSSTWLACDGTPYGFTREESYGPLPLLWLASASGSRNGPSGSSSPLPEGGTDELEFMEEVALVHDALRQGRRGQGHPPLTHVCQTGFNAGVSALAFLCSTPRNVTVHSFDLGEHDYVAVAQDILEHDYGYAKRHRLVLGSSLETLPLAVQKGELRCDFVFVDGGHAFNIASNDIVMFGRMSHTGARLVVENCNVFGQAIGWGGQPSVNRAYRKALASGNIKHIKQVSTGGCHAHKLAHTCRELCVGEWQESNYTI
ncbi:hypothetical protein EMIHUDRAFT_462076 [Emiliania huxleyi CCMP1516]|uniref:Uncharacterized protein n=2 Tax=Emiliania huxleyi TaxID=2903 RepID=A0A0D3KZX9_EMIH1|nr:hypothetical protein EMIHUDRAFT_462076 [Emiliania huxleyi CCMP1516]EOD41314.1 hypothetical protein EMIHUDRAFT_462076 [Emiliania huxleyi CCMP1516]|eukprot:XP_005793743.1 hypothetical protein EMIHUDRAFT_462076 [Emiliania huxleyi CCMP1516]